jgi:hypothetical protein
VKRAVTLQMVVGCGSAIPRRGWGRQCGRVREATIVVCLTIMPGGEKGIGAGRDSAPKRSVRRSATAPLRTIHGAVARDSSDKRHTIPAAVELHSRVEND